LDPASLKTLATAALVATAVMLASCNERPEVFYADAAAARGAGSVDRGWIPDWLPTSARNIYEMHDLDTNESMLAFSFNPADPPDVGQSCTQIQPEALRPVRFRRSWWPNDVSPPPAATHRHVYYRCSDGAYVAMSAKEGRLYHWRSSGAG
jgi:hypothetical protein